MTDLSDEAHNHVLSINYACACYVENLLRGGEIDQNQTRYWEKCNMPTWRTPLNMADQLN